MADTKRTGDRRAQHVALFGGVLQLAVFGLLFGLSFWGDGSHLLAAAARFVLLGVPIWFILYLILNQVRRVGLEALETEELRRAREAGAGQAIFDEAESLLLEQSRLRWMMRWLLPAGTIFVALYLIAGHFVGWGWGWALQEVFSRGAVNATDEPTLMMWFLVGAGFLCFLYARYALAVARLPQWGLVRAGAVCMSGSALACVLAAVALMAGGTFAWAEPLGAYALRAIMLILGLEFTVNFILDLYRPRSPGEIPRPAFDSRLLGMIGEPGGIAKSIADAVNYQFGFEVSSTWFYQLLQRWLFPITTVVMAVILALTSVVIVDADERAVIERFGRPPATVLEPGVHWKWPYPISVVHRTPVRRIHQLVVGETLEDEDHHEHEAIVWIDPHEFVPEMMLLVASRREGRPGRIGERDVLRGLRRRETESVPVNLLMVSVPIQYRVRDISKYLYTARDPEKLLEAAAFRLVSDFAAGVDIDDLMGPKREDFNRQLRRMLQERLDKLDLGIEIVFAGIRSAHPPEKQQVAAAFEGVVRAEISKAAMIHAAEAEARRILIAIAGSENRAEALDEAIRRRDALPPGAPELADAQQRVHELLLGSTDDDLPPIGGDAAAALSRARARASRLANQAAAKALSFSAQLAAFQAAPDLYQQRKLLEVYEDLGAIRKFLIVGDRSNVLIEYETARPAGLDEVLTEGIERERARRGR